MPFWWVSVFGVAYGVWAVWPYVDDYLASPPAAQTDFSKINEVWKKVYNSTYGNPPPLS